MRLFLAVAVAVLATAGGAAADTFEVVPSTAPGPASAQEPNAADAVAFPLQLSLPPLEPQQLTMDDLHALWQRAGEAYGVPWPVLAAINKVESDFGRNMGPSSAGAVGWMQFMPDTWARWGTDADGDGVADPWNPSDAVFSAARYLAAAGAGSDLARGVFAYNHADWYVNEVLSLARTYAGGAVATQGFEGLQHRLAAAEQRVLEANRALQEARSRQDGLEQRSEEALNRSQTLTLLSERLDAQRSASEQEARTLEGDALVRRREQELAAAQAELDAARAGTQAAAFAPGTGSLLAAPAYQGAYAFPVGGGPGVVSVGPNHHDYPAADIAAPEGSPAYALSDGVVLSAWQEPDGRCGIGLTFRSADGLTWTYCHLAYLEPSVAGGVQLTAGAPVGLVGATGHADGPHLHLQLQPPSAYPQDEAWFASFAGTAFSWREASQSNPAPESVFDVLPENGVVYFSAS